MKMVIRTIHGGPITVHQGRIVIDIPNPLPGDSTFVLSLRTEADDFELEQYDAGPHESLSYRELFVRPKGAMKLST